MNEKIITDIPSISKTNTCILKNLRYPDPITKRIKKLDLLYTSGTKKQRGRILKLAPHIDEPGAKVIKYEGEYLLPAFCDIGACFCEPGYEYRETIETGSLSARWGGYANVLISPMADPFADSPAILEARAKKAQSTARCNILQSAALTLGGMGKELCDYGALTAAGAVAFTDGTVPLHDIKILRRAMQICAAKGYLIILCPKQHPDYADCCVTEGRCASLLGLTGEPPAAEAASVAQYLILAEETGCRIHIRDISCAQSVKLIRRAKDDGINVSCSTSPWYFSLCEDDMVFIGSNAKVYPPLRSADQRDAIIEGIKNRTIDCIDSGHTPISKAEKGMDISKAHFGAIGLQSSFSAAVTYLLRPGHIDIFRLAELFCYAPARILGICDKEGIDTDTTAFNILSCTEEFILTNSYLKGRSTNCPYVGLSLCGMIKDTVIL